MPNGDPTSLLIGLVAVVGVVLQFLVWYRDHKERDRQLGLLARQTKAIEDMVVAQSRVVSELAEAQKEKSSIWKEEIERRRRKDEFEKTLTLWDQLRDVLDF